MSDTLPAVVVTPGYDPTWQLLLNQTFTPRVPSARAQEMGIARPQVSDFLNRRYEPLATRSALDPVTVRATRMRSRRPKSFGRGGGSVAQPSLLSGTIADLYQMRLDVLAGRKTQPLDLYQQSPIIKSGPQARQPKTYDFPAYEVTASRLRGIDTSNISQLSGSFGLSPRDQIARSPGAKKKDPFPLRRRPQEPDLTRSRSGELGSLETQPELREAPPGDKRDKCDRPKRDRNACPKVGYRKKILTWEKIPCR